jgi:hypothetical protein
MCRLASHFGRKSEIGKPSGKLRPKAFTSKPDAGEFGRVGVKCADRVEEVGPRLDALIVQQRPTEDPCKLAQPAPNSESTMREARAPYKRTAGGGLLLGS